MGVDTGKIHRGSLLRRIDELEVEKFQLATKLKTALETLNDARWFNAIACLTGDDCSHTRAEGCLSAICDEAEKLGDQIQAAIDAAQL